LFTPNFFLLNTIISGNGNISSTPAGIDCGNDCSQAYTPNTVVTLTATPDPDNVFVEWTANCNSINSNACTVTMDASKVVRALFNPLPSIHALNINVVGNGTITSNPVGINCGVDCTDDYAINTSVSLTATPQAGFNFTGCSGDCTGSGSCVVSMTQARNVTATFNAIDIIFKNDFELSLGDL
jgi:hypothetical protein